MAKILVINPTISHEWDAPSLEYLRAAAASGTQLEVVSLDWGPASIESRVDDDLAAPGILMSAIQAERQGAEAILISCMNDPGLTAARESVRIPVVGPAQASMHLAAMLSHRFSMITTGTNDIPVVEELVARYRMTDRLASVRAIDIPVLGLGTQAEATREAVVSVAEAAVLQDGAGAIILGCTLLADLAPQIRSDLSDRGIDVPLINPILAALRLAETLVSLGLSHSSRSYAPPGDKPLIWPIPPLPA
jgi:allantoin racemase